ncbi:DEAD-domain-containing protein [Coniochaeta ligniaria NRRL 30616]|uniref:ATP-dependent RNA helicase n=1 Tax=Coniochaeta ligniaria NRRL 30616 TaxID=1408157 RepID=A0A1J7JWG3_9PEZI|nr:DEAD-domain-containing protein [Coniochaeta ligniaria NRRL 30616]
MLKTTLSRQSRLCFAAARNARLVTRVASRPVAQSLLAPSTRIISKNALSVLSSFQPRLYSTDAAEAEATETSEPAKERVQQDISRFGDLTQINVHPSIVDAITKDFGYENMTDVQRLTINAALAGKDMVAQAKTGTGKTLAFLVPVLQRIIEQDASLATRGARKRYARADDIRAIILSPTRELAEQIAVEAQRLAQNTGIIVQRAVGGSAKRQMLQQVQRQGCHLLVATPGRLNDILSDPNSGIDAPNCAALVLDEADRMLDVGFSAELEQIVSYLPSRKQVPRQTLLFSATIPKSVISLAKTYVDPYNFEFVQTISENDEPTHHKVPQHIVTCKGIENVYATLVELVQREVEAAKTTGEPFKAIVFLPTTLSVVLANSLFMSLRNMERNIPFVTNIHSRLTQDKRTRAADRFKMCESGILLSSDVTARGMDFPNVTHVIQICSPPDEEQYIHRLGRTGRAGKNGQGWLLVLNDEIRHVRQMMKHLPIKPASELQSPGLDMLSPEVKEGTAPGSEFAKKTIAAFENVPKDQLEDTYMSLVGVAVKSIDQKQAVIDRLNDFVTAFGMEEPPAISPKLAQQMGLSRLRGVTIGHRERSLSQDSSFGGNRRGSGGFGGRGGSGGYGGSRSDDPFSKIREAGSDRRGPSAYGGHGGGSVYGGSRPAGGSSRGGGSRDGGRDGGFSRGGGSSYGGSRDGGRSGGFGGNRGGSNYGGNRDGGRSSDRYGGGSSF